MAWRFYGGPMAGRRLAVREEDLQTPYYCRTWAPPALSLAGRPSRPAATEIADAYSIHVYDFREHPHHGWGFYYREEPT